jgi:hypothetical protein
MLLMFSDPRYSIQIDALKEGQLDEAGSKSRLEKSLLNQVIAYIQTESMKSLYIPRSLREAFVADARVFYENGQNQQQGNVSETGVLYSRTLPLEVSMLYRIKKVLLGPGDKGKHIETIANMVEMKLKAVADDTTDETGAPAATVTTGEDADAVRPQKRTYLAFDRESFVREAMKGLTPDFIDSVIVLYEYVRIQKEWKIKNPKPPDDPTESQEQANG